MRLNPCLLIALSACAVWTSSCATSDPQSVRPPRLAIPAEAQRACALPVLSADPTLGDLDAVYALRGQALAMCDGRRDLAVQTLHEEHRLIDAWLAMIKPRPWWRRLWPG